MKIPARLKLMGVTWKISQDMPSEDRWGLTEFKENTIHIRKDLSQQNKEMTLIHEILHVITFQTGIDRLIEPDLEEKVVNMMANGLYEVYKIGFFKG